MPDWQEVDDRQLLKEAREGNVEAFGHLYERHVRSVFRFLYYHLDNYLDAEDLTGEVFLRAWRSLPRYNERGIPFSAYLLRIARNGLIDHYRRVKRLGHRSASREDEDQIDLDPEPSEVVGVRLEHQELKKVLAQLREDYQTVLVLRFISELSPEETARVMQRTVGAVRVLQHRALAALRALLDKL